MKVVDIWNRSGSDFFAALRDAIAEVDSERRTLEMCNERRLSRIVHLVASGQYRVPRLGERVEANVFFFVFELADSDVRKQIAFGENSQIVWKLTVLKDVALAIDQLDRLGISHNDVKPSNVLSIRAYDERIHKLADLGRAVSKNVPGPFDGHDFCGDPKYAPPCAYYAFQLPEWVDRRTAKDLYMLGALACYLFSGLNLTVEQRKLIPKQKQPRIWRGGYEGVLPDWIDAHAQTLERMRQSFPKEYMDELTNLIYQLTHPDPRIRGNPTSRARLGRPAGTDVFVSRFSALAKRAALSRIR